MFGGSPGSGRMPSDRGISDSGRNRAAGFRRSLPPQNSSRTSEQTTQTLFPRKLSAIRAARNGYRNVYLAVNRLRPGREHSWRERKSPHSPRILHDEPPTPRPSSGRHRAAFNFRNRHHAKPTAGRKHLSAFPASSAEAWPPAGDTSFTQDRTMPSRAPVWSAGVHSAPQNTKKTLAIDAEIRAPSLLKTRISSKPFFRAKVKACTLGQ